MQPITLINEENLASSDSERSVNLGVNQAVSVPWHENVDIGVGIIAYAICMHLIWAVTLTAAPDAGFTTRTAAGHEVLGFAYPASLFIAALCGLVCLDRYLSAWWFVLAAIPQQFFLTMSAYTAVNAICRGTFPDGVVRTTAFLLVDQSPALLAAFFHAVAIVAGWMDRMDRGGHE